MWKDGAKTAFGRFLWVGVPVVIWVLLSRFELLSETVAGSGTLIISVVLFVLAIPFSMIFRLDTASSYFAFQEMPEAALLVSLLFVLANYLLIGAFMGWLRGRRNESGTPQ